MNKTVPYINKYERAQLLAIRTKEISEGAPIAVNPPPNSSFLDIAKLEFSLNKIPYKIYREYYNKTGEVWDLKELHK